MDQNAPEEIKASHFVMSVDDELVQCVVLDDGENVQANVVTSEEHGIGAWALFARETDNVTIANAMAPLVRAGNMKPDMDVTRRVSGALVAGTAKLPVQEVEPEPEPEPQTVH